MALTHYPPVPDEISKAMLTRLFEAGRNIIPGIFPAGYLEDPLVWRYRQHLLWEYKWYRLERFTKLKDPGQRPTVLANPIPLSLRAFKEQNIPRTLDEKKESLLLLASAVAAVFEYPHAVIDPEGWCYRLGVSEDGKPTKYDFLRDILVTDRFLGRKARYYGGEEVCEEPNLSIYGDDGITMNADFYPVFCYLFSYLNDSGFDWDFGSYEYIISDMWYRKMMREQEASDECQNLENYDPLQAMLGELGVAEEPVDPEKLDEASAEAFRKMEADNRAYGMVSYLTEQPIIQAYTTVYGHPPKGLPV